MKGVALPASCEQADGLARVFEDAALQYRTGTGAALAYRGAIWSRVGAVPGRSQPSVIGMPFMTHAEVPAAALAGQASQPRQRPPAVRRVEYHDPGSSSICWRHTSGQSESSPFAVGGGLAPSPCPRRFSRLRGWARCDPRALRWRLSAETLPACQPSQPPAPCPPGA